MTQTSNSPRYGRPTGNLSQIQICNKYAHPPRLESFPTCLHASQSCRYIQASVAEPQLYCAIFSHCWPRIGKTIQDIVFSEPSGNKNPPNRCHSHARAWRSTTSGGAPGGQWLKCCFNQCELTPEVFLSLTPSGGAVTSRKFTK